MSELTNHSSVTGQRPSAREWRRGVDRGQVLGTGAVALLLLGGLYLHAQNTSPISDIATIAAEPCNYVGRTIEVAADIQRVASEVYLIRQNEPVAGEKVLLKPTNVLAYDISDAGTIAPSVRMISAAQSKGTIYESGENKRVRGRIERVENKFRKKACVVVAAPAPAEK